MSRARQLLEMALELGDDPDAIHPQHKQALRQGTHAMGKVPAFSAHNAQQANPAERHAAASYRNVLAKLRTYGGVVPRSTADAHRVAADMMRTLQTLMQREQGHEQELEQLAIETVLRLPEFSTLRRAVRDGTVKIEAKLGQPDLSDVQVAPQEAPEEEQEPEEVKAEYDELVGRRKLVNLMAQGAAVSNNYAFAYYAREELNALDPQLVRDYAKLMAYSELGQFMQGTEIARAAAQGGGGGEQGGASRVRREDDGSAVVEATGLTFPILVHEIIKGVMELLTMTGEEDPDVQTQVQKRADVIGDEQYQQQMGPSIWREFITAIGHDQAEVMPYVYDELNRLPPGEYHRKMQALIGGQAEGKRWFSELARKIKQEMASDALPDKPGAQTEAQRLVKRLIGG
jgi:hypothetical protein